MRVEILYLSGKINLILSMRNSKWALFLLLLTCSLAGFSQKIDNITAEFDGERIIITYDLTPGKATDKFNVVLKSSHDNYEKPLKFLMGDAGTNVLPGARNRIIWDVKSELPSDFNGNVTLKFEIETIIPLVIEERSALSAKPLYKNVFKRGTDLRLEWTGGSRRDSVKIDLFKGDNFSQTIERVGNETKNYIWHIPKKQKKGSYFLRLSDQNGQDISATQIFTVKPKTPFIVKVLPVLAVGAGAYFLFSGGGDDPPKELPAPIGPPSN